MPVTPQDPASPTPKGSRRGCWISLAILTALFAAAIYVIFYTSIPARFLLGKASKKGDFQAEGVGGSLASGRSSINVFRFDTGASSQSEIHGFEVIYPSFGPYNDGEFTIESLTVDRAILRFDSQNMGDSRKRDEDNPEENRKTDSGESKDKRSPRGFRMHRLEAAHVTISVEDLGWELDFTRGLKISDVHGTATGLNVGGLTLDGDAIRLEIPPFASSPDKDQPTAVAATLTFTPILSPSVLRNLQLDIALQFLAGKSSSSEISAFNSRAKTRFLPGSDGLWSLAANDLTIGDFIAGWFPGAALHLDATYHHPTGKWHSLTAGSFTLGGQSWTLSPFENQPTDTLHAKSEHAGTQLHLAIHFADGFAAPILTFSSAPTLTESEIKALLDLPQNPAS